MDTSDRVRTSTFQHGFQLCTGIKGDVANEWHRLCFVLSVSDAFDAVKKNRTTEIWAFQKAIEHFIHLKPVFNSLIEDLKENGDVRLVGSEEIVEYFLVALRETAKKQKGFKSLVKKLQINGLEVLGNNKFKVTTRFAFKFIRLFTDGEITRSGNETRCTITKVGKYSYTYRIRSLRSSERKKRVKVKVQSDPIPL